MKYIKDVSRKELLLIAGIVWILAGSMVMNVGIESYFKIETRILYFIPIMVIVFISFYFEVFRKLVSKNFKRIDGLKEKDRKIISFMDGKSYIIMAVMMSSGIFIRKKFHLPMLFFFTFYTGLGAALFAAGVSYICKMKYEE